MLLKNVHKYKSERLILRYRTKLELATSSPSLYYTSSPEEIIYREKARKYISAGPISAIVAPSLTVNR